MKQPTRFEKKVRKLFYGNSTIELPRESLCIPPHDVLQLLTREHQAVVRKVKGKLRLYEAQKERHRIAGCREAEIRYGVLIEVMDDLLTWLDRRAR